MVDAIAITEHKANPAFGHLCDAVAYRSLVTITGSGVSVGLPSARPAAESLPTWHAVVTSLRARFSDRLQSLDSELDLLLRAGAHSSEYLIEAATLIRRAVGVGLYRDAIVDLTTPQGAAHSQLHDLVEHLEPRGILTFNYDMGHEHAYRAIRGRGSPPLRRALYSDEHKLRAILAGDFDSRFLLKAHGCISRPHSIVLDRASYRQIMARQPGYRAFVQHVLTRFSVLIVGFGLNDPDFDDLLQSFEANFGGGIRDHVYIWKRGQRADEEARAVLLRRRYGLACIFVDDFADVRTIISDARTELGPRLQGAVTRALLRSPEAAKYLRQRRAAHREFGKLSHEGARIATAALRACAVDETRSSQVRAEAVYSLGKIRPTVENTLEFLLDQVDPQMDPEVATYALAAILQLEPPAAVELARWMRNAASLIPACDRIDERMSARPQLGRPRARKYMEALLARWEAT